MRTEGQGKGESYGSGTQEGDRDSGGRSGLEVGVCESPFRGFGAFDGF